MSDAILYLGVLRFSSDWLRLNIFFLRGLSKKKKVLRLLVALSIRLDRLVGSKYTSLLSVPPTSKPKIAEGEQSSSL